MSRTKQVRHSMAKALTEPGAVRLISWPISLSAVSGADLKCDPFSHRFGCMPYKWASGGEGGRIFRVSRPTFRVRSRPVRLCQISVGFL